MIDRSLKILNIDTQIKNMLFQFIISQKIP
jgi:hypothetical protein